MTNVQPEPPATVIEQPTAVIEEPQPSTSGGEGNKRKQPEDHEEIPQQPPKKAWHDEGDLDTAPDGTQFRWIKADKVPGQKRLRGMMSDDEKLLIALENERTRQYEQQNLRQHGIIIKYTGKNTPMGIPGQGYYDYTNPKHKLAVIKVGRASKTTMQSQLEIEIKALEKKEKEDMEKMEKDKQKAQEEEKQRQEREQQEKEKQEKERQEKARQEKEKQEQEAKNKQLAEAIAKEDLLRVVKIHITYGGKNFYVFLYKTNEGLKENDMIPGSNKILVKQFPSRNLYNLNGSRFENVLSNELYKHFSDSLSQDELTKIYWYVINKHKEMLGAARIPFA